MTGFWKKVGVATALAATALTAAAPADAQRYGYRGYRGYHHHGNSTGAAILGGLVGLGVGAAIASSDRPRYYDRGYYAPPPPPAYYYDRGYGYDGYYQRCYDQWRYDPYYGGRVRVRVCD